MQSACNFANLYSWIFVVKRFMFRVLLQDIAAQTHLELETGTLNQ